MFLTSEKNRGRYLAAVVLSGSARTFQEGQQGFSISEMAIEMAWFLAVGFGPLHAYLVCCFGKMDARWDESKGSNLEMKKRWLQEQKKGDLKLEKCWGPGVLEAIWDESQMEKGWQNHWMMERWWPFRHNSGRKHVSCGFFTTSFHILTYFDVLNSL